MYSKAVALLFDQKSSRADLLDIQASRGCQSGRMHGAMQLSAEALAHAALR